VAAALRLIRSKPDERLTMRRLAAELDTGAASLYVYFKDTDSLYSAVLDELLRSLSLVRGRTPWRDRLISLLTAYLDLLTGYPPLAKTALFTRPSGASSVGLWEAMLALLSEGAIVGRDAAWAADLLLQRATATAAEEGERRLDTNTAVADGQVAEVIEGLSPKRYPHLASLSNEMMSGTPTTRLIWSFEVFLNGITATRNKPPRQTNKRRRTGSARRP
jgi:AcrR family transcriptional regulator